MATGGPTPEADVQSIAALKVTEAARAMVLEARDAEPDGATLGLWLEVAGVSGGAFRYDMYFQRVADAGTGDEVTDDNGLTVVIPERSLAMVKGSTLDVSGEGEAAGMVVINPNPVSPPLAGTGPVGDLSGDVAQRVLAVLDQQVNPSIASHGGHAELVAVDGSVAYLRLSGGCQGCGMAAATLRQGIEVAIMDSVAEIESIVDVTDHASGANPYYEPVH